MKFEVKQKDILDQSSGYILVEIEEYDKGHLVYKYQDGTYYLDVNDTDLSLKYEASDTRTIMTSHNKMGSCVVENSLGKLEFELYVLQQVVKDDHILVEYKLFQQGMVVSHFIYEWKGR